MADKLSNGLFISEILADNAGGGAVDVNGSGGANKQDEYIEIQNSSGGPINLNGIQIFSQRDGQLHSFTGGETIDAGETATIIGTYTGPQNPGGDTSRNYFGSNGSAGNNRGSNNGFLFDGEGNKRDSIILLDTNTNEFVILSYGEPPQPPAVNPDGTLVSPPPGFPATATRIGDGESIDSGSPNGTAFSRDANGDFTEDPTPTPGDPDTPCFCAGTLIETDAGPVAVEDLAPGTGILTLDRGIQPLLGVGLCRIGRAALAALPDLRPITVPAGVLGATATLRLSPAHRILLSGGTVELVTSLDAVLAPVGSLRGLAGIERDDSLAPVTFVHLLFANHEIVRANGIWTESLFAGARAGRFLHSGDWRMAGHVGAGTLLDHSLARPVARRREARVCFEPVAAH
ncbi:MAG: Hint domain-containing protein [Pseudomonadota bacterium]